MTNLISQPYPLGATLYKTESHTIGCNFSIHAPACSSIQLALFSADNSYTLHSLTEQYIGICHVFIPGITAGQKYGYVVEIDDQIYLISDPYAKAIDKELHFTPPYTTTQSFTMPKCIVVDDKFDWQEVKHPSIPREEMVLFETHVKGLTQQHPNLDKQTKGHYLGLINPEMLHFYQENNINTLQLLPIAACMHESHLLEMNKVNYWGYNPYLFMAPDPRYANQNAVIELKTAIRELHRHDIEVILDVVYNHTAEGGEGPRIFNLKALDPQFYLRYEAYYANYTGCGNTVDLTYQPALNLIMDTLRYWVQEYHVDGFRFDLAATLGREGDNYNQQAAFFKAIAQDPILRDIKLIAEPWDIGPNGYQVGHFPFGWNECNDKFRDITRSFWRGDLGYLKEFATRLMGSRDIYSAANWPHKLTVNYITYHDGFTLQDLVSYKQKHNEANGEQNRDGHGDNRSDNYGEEGSTTSKAILKLRAKQKRNLMASLLFSFGIPHILTADMLSHSQQGNNNAYCQDNELSWINWETDPEINSFKIWMGQMIAKRQQYMVPFIRAFSGEGRNQNRVVWRCLNGNIIEHDDWNRITSVALHIGINKSGQELLYLINQNHAPARFTLPNDRGQRWMVICDSNVDSLDLGFADEEVLLPSTSIAILYFQPGNSEHLNQLDANTRIYTP